MQSTIYVYKIARVKINVALISFLMRCHSVGCETASQTQSAIQLITQGLTADYMNAVIRVYDDAGNVIETHEHTGEFKE